jgi:hypothetical protein
MTNAGMTQDEPDFEGATRGFRVIRSACAESSAGLPWGHAAGMSRCGAGDGNRTHVSSLGSWGNGHYTTPAEPVILQGILGFGQWGGLDAGIETGTAPWWCGGIAGVGVSGRP